MARRPTACSWLLWRHEPTWVISRYEDIRAALVDPRLSADTIPDELKPMGVRRQHTGRSSPRIDDPEHNRLRRMMTRDFTFRRAEAMRPQIQELVDGFLDDMIENGPPADLVRDFALPVPSLVISLLLGVPYEDHEFFQHHSTVGLDSQVDRRGEVGAIGRCSTTCAELVAAQGTRTGRRPDQPAGHRLRRDGRTQPRDRRHERRDHAAGRSRNHGEHDRAGHRDTAAASRRSGAAAAHRRPGLGRQHRRRADALPDHRAQPGRPGGHSKTSPSTAS